MGSVYLFITQNRTQVHYKVSAYELKTNQMMMLYYYYYYFDFFI